MNSTTNHLLSLISDFREDFKGAFNIRENGGCAGRQSTETIRIEPRQKEPGIDIYISAAARHETVYIPACVTKSGVNDLVYNDFHVEDGADVVIVAGCGVHSDGEDEAVPNDTIRERRNNPVTQITLEEGACMEIDTTQISGVNHSERSTCAVLAKDAKLIIHERLLTDGAEKASSDFSVTLEGEDSGVDLISRSVAKGNSYQEYRSVIRGNCRCMGHLSRDIDASLIHEAAIGKIAGEQITKLCTLGLTEQEAEQKIIEGFLK